MRIDNDITLNGNKLVLREIEYADLENIRMLRNTPNNLMWFKNKNIISYDQQKTWFEKYKVKKDDFMFVILIDNSFVGTISLYNMDYYKKKCEFGRLMIKSEWKGKGIAFNAINLILNWGIEEFNIKTFNLEVYIDNKIAINLYKKVGFIQKNVTNNLIYMEYEVV